MASVTKTAGSVTNNTTSGETYWQKNTYTGGGDPPADLGLSYLELLSDDNEYALWLGGGETSYYLQCTQFDFSAIPDGAQINGIELSFKRLNTGSADAFDLTIKLVKNGTITGNNKSVGATWSVAEETVTFGGASDLWGVSLTAADVKASNFGVAIQIEKDVVFGDPDPRAGIDYLTLTVHYDGPTSTNNSCNFSITGSFTGNPNNYLDFFTHGKTSDNNPVQFYTRGTLNNENFETLPFYTLNTVPSNSNFAFYINGETLVNAGVRLFTHGKSAVNNNLPLFIAQYPPPSPGGSASINMFLRALTQDEAFPPSGGNTTGTVNFVIYRPDAYDFSVLNDNPASPLSSMNLFLKGAISAPTTSNLNLFLKNIPFSVSEGISLFLYNSIELYFNNLPLFTKGLGLSGSEDDVEGSEGYTPFGGSMNLFIQRNTPGSINLYLQGPAQPTNDSFPLYINSNLTSASGIRFVIPYTIGRPNNPIKLFTTGF